MKKLLLTMLGVLLALPAIAHDFSYEYEGQTINYTIIDEDEKNVAVAGWNNVSGELTIPSNPKEGEVEYTLTSIGGYAFYGCEDLTSVEIPNSVTSIEEYAFAYCTSLTSVEIPNSVTSIGDSAFEECTSLTSVEIPNSVISFGHYTFHSCTSLTSVEISNSVTYIGNYAFCGCTSLTSINIPDSVTHIGSCAFGSCNSLTSIDIPNSVNYIINSAFEGCSSLISIDIPNSVISIGQGAFRGCTSLTSIDIPDSVIEIDPESFAYCSSLTSIEVSTGNKFYSSSNGVLFNKDQTRLIQYPGGKWGEYIIPNFVITIQDDAFSGCSSLTSIDIPNSVTSIGYGAFRGCSSLTSIKIPSSVTSIQKWAFDGCSSLTSIEVNIWNEFYSSSEGVLFNIEQTSLIRYPEGKRGHYIIPNSVTRIGEYAFYDCNGLTSIEIPNSVTYIQDFAFYYSSLTSVKIPNSVTYIGWNAFSECTSLTSVEIPNSVTYIGNGAFSGCNSLTSVYYNSTEPVKADYSVFYYTTYSNATLYVPEEAVETYQQTWPWNKFQNIQGYPFSTGVEDVSSGIDETLPCEYFNLSGVKMGNTKESLAPGIYIIRQGNATKKIVVR